MWGCWEASWLRGEAVLRRTFPLKDLNGTMLRALTVERQMLL